MLQLRKPNGQVLQQALDASAGMNYAIHDDVQARPAASTPKRRLSEAIGQPNAQGISAPSNVPSQQTNVTGPYSRGSGILDETYRGWIGTVFAPILLGGPSTNGYNDSCPATEFGGSCTTGGPRGGALAAQLAYSYGWIAPEAMLAMSLDLSSAGLVWPPDLPIPGDVNGILAQIAGNTKFLRLGIMAGAGARVSSQAQGHRFTLSGILGLVKRHVYIIPDSFFGSKPSYTAPTMFFDAGVMIGDTPGIKVYAGLFLWLEFVPHMSFSRDVTTVGLVPDTVPASLRTITPFSGTQVMFGPLVGVTFGH